MKKHEKIAAHLEHLHRNPPAPFNPDYDPDARARGDRVVQSMEADGYYTAHNRPECRDEYRRRYEAEKAAGR